MLIAQLVVQNGDRLEDIVRTALKVVALPKIGYAVFEFNGRKLFVLKRSSYESVMREYKEKSI